MSGQKLQDGTAIKRINDAIQIFQKYQTGEVSKSSSDHLNQLRNIRMSVGLAWPVILKYCFLHVSSHCGVVRFLTDLACTVKVGVFPIISSIGDFDPFDDVGLIFSKSCIALKISDSSFLTPPDFFASKLTLFFSAMSVNARVETDMLHEIEDRYTYRTGVIGELLSVYMNATLNLDDWVVNLDELSQPTRAQMLTLLAQNRNMISNEIRSYVNKNLDHPSEHLAAVAKKYNQEWDIGQPTPNLLPVTSATEIDGPESDTESDSYSASTDLDASLRAGSSFPTRDDEIEFSLDDL
nr:non-structural protein [Homalodisca vitripennis reovirus]